MPENALEPVPMNTILACFTTARRLHEGKTRGALARQLGIRADQVTKAENGKPCGSEAEAKLMAWNGLEDR